MSDAVYEIYRAIMNLINHMGINVLFLSIVEISVNLKDNKPLEIKRYSKGLSTFSLVSGKTYEL
jgi:hypothetical protein